jgi:hypothetical protein
MTEQSKELKSFTGAYVMILQDRRVIVTGREKYKNFKAVFSIQEIEDFLASSRIRTNHKLPLVKQHIDMAIKILQTWENEQLMDLSDGSGYAEISVNRIKHLIALLQKDDDQAKKTCNPRKKHENRPEETIPDRQIADLLASDLREKLLKKPSGLAKCAGCGETLIAPDDGEPWYCTECSYEKDLKARHGGFV